MFDHIGFPVADVARSRSFYLAALAPLDIAIAKEVTAEMTGGDVYIGFGLNGRPQFWIGSGHKIEGRLHVAFAAKTRDHVEAFYKAALAAGGVDNGAPGLRPHYHTDYYAAFVLDPDGHNIEAVCNLSA